jgi:hypothetical protein
VTQPTSEETISLSFGPSNEAVDDHGQRCPTCLATDPYWRPDDRECEICLALAEMPDCLHELAVDIEAGCPTDAAAQLNRLRQIHELIAEHATTLAAETIQLRIQLQAAEAALANQEQRLREQIADALFKRSSDLVIEAGHDGDDIMAAIISAEAQGFSNAALFIRDRTEQVPDDE